MDRDPTAVAREIVDVNLYMVLGTADPTGQPWATPVYYAPAHYREFYWVSSPDTRHSCNIETRREVSIVIFDSTAPIDAGNGVYMSAFAEELLGDERKTGIDVFSARSLAHGSRPWTLQDVDAPARLRLYRATALDVYVLDPHTDRRLRVAGEGIQR